MIAVSNPGQVVWARLTLTKHLAVVSRRLATAATILLPIAFLAGFWGTELQPAGMAGLVRRNAAQERGVPPNFISYQPTFWMAWPYQIAPSSVSSLYTSVAPAALVILGATPAAPRLVRATAPVPSASG